jgi:hypothetical protein
MITPDQAEAIQRIGVLGVIVVGLLAFYTRKVRPGADLADAQAATTAALAAQQVLYEARLAELKSQYEARLSDVRVDRDDWRTIAQGAVAKLDDIADLLRDGPH